MKAILGSRLGPRIVRTRDVNIGGAIVASRPASGRTNAGRVYFGPL
jgi:hypothetical protein